jgi:group II intron reverse transcriptase/maturase
MQTSLERIANKAKRDKKYRFQNLYRLLNEERLASSWIRLNKKAASGADGISYHEYAKGIAEKISKLTERLRAKRYKAKLIRRHYIPKTEGRMRPLGIPTIEDKLVQHAAAQILQAIYEQDFLTCSYGYRPKRDAKSAVKDLRASLQEGNYWYIVEADIKGFFDNINHDWLIRMLEQRIDDKAFIGLIRKWLKAGVLETDDKVIHPLTGTPQGGIISPVLANIYMHYCLCLWFEKVVKKHCKGMAYLCVYADDFVCAFEFKDDAKRFYKVLGKRFEKFNLQLSPEKTKIVEFNRWTKEAFDFLGFEFKMSAMSRRHVRIRTSRKKLRNSIKAIKEWCKENRQKKLNDLFAEVNAKLRGYYNYYGIKGNSESLLRVHLEVQMALFKWLNRRSQRKSLNWEAFKKIKKHFNLILPTIANEATNCL